MTDRESDTGARWGIDRWSRRPVLSVAVLGLVVAAGNIWWAAAHRAPGALTIDEAGYISRSLTYHRVLDPAHPGAVLSEFLRPSPTGGFVPLLSLPTLVIGPRSVGSAIAAQALIGLVAAVAAAGCVARIATKRAALVGGIVVLMLPAMTLSARSYQFAGAAGAALLLACWALLASDRGRRPLMMVAFGASVGIMLLTRPMTAGFVPGIALAVVVLVDWSKRVVAWVAAAAATAVVVAGPWWYRSRGEISDYLVDYGYGDESTNYGGESVPSRVVSRALSGVGDLRIPLILVGLGVVVVSIHGAVVWHRQSRPLRSFRLVRRDLGALLAVIVVGYAALMSTANLGVWFELPLELVAVVVVTSVGGLLGGETLRRLGLAAVAISVLSFTLSLTDPGGEYDLGTPRGVAQGMFVGGLWDRAQEIAGNDERFRSNDGGERSAAAQDWSEASVAVAAMVDEWTTGDEFPFVSMTGSTQLLNANTLAIAYESMSREAPGIEVPETRPPDEFLLPYLEPLAGASPRTLLVITPTTEQLREDIGADRLRALAINDGWEVVATTDLPDGGIAELFRHPAAESN